MNASTAFSDRENEALVDETVLEKSRDDVSFNMTHNATSVEETMIEKEKALPKPCFTTTIEPISDSQFSITTDDFNDIVIPETPMKSSPSPASEAINDKSMICDIDELSQR